MSSSKDMHESIKLTAGKDHPQTYREFVTMFPDDKSCREFLYKLRWDNGFVCPRCKVTSKEPWHQTHKRLVCPNCRHQTTVIAETIFDKTRTPLTTWLEAAWHLTLYQMRHSFASLMISNNEDILWVSNMLGHKDSSMTLEKYARYIKQTDKKRATFLTL